MIDGLNYVKDGVWYITNDSDIDFVYKRLLSLYNKYFKTNYGESKYCNLIIYNGYIILENYGNNILFNETITIDLSLNSNLNKDVQKMCNDIINEGILVNPIYYIKFKYKTRDIKSYNNSYMIMKNGIRRYKNTFCLKGIIK